MRRPAVGELPVGRVLAAALGARVGIDTVQQLFNPFLAVFAVGFGTSVTVLGSVVALRSLTGFVGPFAGAWADRVGYLPALRWSLLATTVGVAGFAAAPNVVWAAVAVVPMGVGLTVFIPSLQALLSARLPFEQRAAGLGTIEYAWALSGVIGLSLLGLAIHHAGWRVPVAALAGFLGLLWVGTMWLRDPGARTAARSRPKAPTEPQRATPLRRPSPSRTRAFTLSSTTERAAAFLSLGPARRSAWSAIAIVGLTFFAMMTVFVVHGAWLQDAFELRPDQLGAVALWLGLCDLVGVLVVARVADRFGKRRMLIVGAGLGAAAYPAVTALPLGLWGALAGLGLLRFALQLTYVSNLPLLSEQVPASRGKVLALGFAVGQLGLATAAIVGPWLYVRSGSAGLGAAAGAATLVVLFLALAWLRERPDAAAVATEIPRRTTPALEEAP